MTILAPHDSMFSIPEHDHAAFARLPTRVRENILRLLRALRAIHQASNRKAACRFQSAAFRDEPGYSDVTLARKYYSFIEAGSWTALINKAKAGRAYCATDATGLPPEFVQFWQSRCDRNKRKNRPAWRKLIDQWKRWRAGDRASAMPGYAQCPEDCGKGYPAGWSYSNLCKRGPDSFERETMRIGLAASAKYRPKVLTTRVGLRVGQYFVFDDMWHDLKVNVPGQSGARRLLQLHALDLFSACLFARGTQPMIRNEDQTQNHIKERDMIFLLAHVLSQYGYLESGTTLVVEHGTAAVREDVEQRLHDLLGGKVTVQRSGFEGDYAVGGMFAGKGKGNFRFKAHLESLHNLIHNETADVVEFPGQVGSNSRLNAPEELSGRDHVNERLIKELAKVPEERRALARLPFISLAEAMDRLEIVHSRINGRTDHELEGWVKAGLHVCEWRLREDMPWMPAATLVNMTEQERAVVAAVVGGNPLLSRSRAQSPKEVFDAGSSALRRINGAQVAMLLHGNIDAREVRVGRDHLFTLSDSEIDSEPMRFLARLGDSDYLPEGERYEAVLNPFNPADLHLFTAQGKYLGAAPRENRVCRADGQAVRRQMGHAAKIQADLIAPLNARNADLNAARAQDARVNAAIISGKPVTSEEKAAKRQTERLMRSVDLTAEDCAKAGPTKTGVSEDTSVLDEYPNLFNDTQKEVWND